MRQVSEGFLLNIAEVSGTLIGLLLVGVFFYVETGLRRLESARRVAESFVRAQTRTIIVLYAIPLGLSLTLVALEPVWSRLFFAVLSVVLLAAMVDTSVRLRAMAKLTGSAILRVSDVGSWVVIVALVILPWALGGLHPSRGDLTWAILISLTSGFVSTCTLVMSVFDIARLETAAGTGDAAGR